MIYGKIVNVMKNDKNNKKGVCKMKKLNLTQLENVNGRWFWEKPYSDAVYENYGMCYFHKILGKDFCLTQDRNQKIVEISGSDANAFIRCMQVGVADKAKSNLVIK